MRQTIKLTESELKKIINESVKMVLNEVSYNTAKEAFKKAYDRARGGETDRQTKQRNNLHQHFVERSGQNFDPNMPVVIVGGDLQGQYTAQEIVDKFDVTGFNEPSQNAIYADSKIIGYPHIKHYIGPMWDGDRIRYESQDAYDLFSR